MKSPIELYLSKEITSKNKIPFSEFMNIALFHKEYGYYTNKSQIFGSEGDFITSPITSSLFGESISNEFINLNSVAQPMSILELGGGDASLAISLIKNLAKIKSLPEKYIILEISNNLIEVQKRKIKEEIPELYELFSWVNNLENQKIKGLIIANEFFDALPSERFRMRNGKVENLYIKNHNNSFEYTWFPATELLKKELSAAKNNHPILIPENYTSDINLQYRRWIANLENCLESGAIFIIDYGYNTKEYFLEERNEGTLVCIYNHKANFDPLFHIGQQDLSTFVNFSHLTNIVNDTKMSVEGYITQANFLVNLGILDLFENKKYDDDEKVIELNRLKNILLPNTMGEIFKVLVLKKNINNQLRSIKEFNHIHKL
jgi:SAM-dependent MidA family methyltransferase